MDWGNCRYKNIGEKISDEDVNKMIDIMIDNYDYRGKYFESYKVEEFIKDYVHNPEFFTFIDKIAHSEIEKEGYDILDPLLFCCSDSEYKDEKIRLRKEYIYNVILNQIEQIARKKRDNRFFHRLQIGDVVNFDTCINHSSFLGKIEFYKDGGWGIADENGTVIVKNHLTQEPSQLLYNRLYNINNCPYCIIKDRDSEKYGVLSLETFQEIIHCHYDEIKIDSYYRRELRSFGKLQEIQYSNNSNDKIGYKCERPQIIIKARKKFKWGCFDENCTLLIDCIYDDIHWKNGYIECIREGNVLSYDAIEGKDLNCFIDGKKDLYNMDGILMVGGYDYLEIELDNFLFYFGTKQEHFYTEETGLYHQEYKISKPSLNYNDSQCLILDSNFRTLFKKNGNRKSLKGQIFNSVEELIRIVPSEYLLKYRVDISNLHNGFIYLHNYLGEQYIVPYYIKEGYDTPEDLEAHKVDILNRIGVLKKQLGIDEQTTNDLTYSSLFDNSEIKTEISQDLYVEDTLVTILKLNDNKEIEWIEYVNEIGLSNCSTYVYRKGKKYGIYNKEGVDQSLYDAITKDSPDGKVYVASFEYCQDFNAFHMNNPNYIQREHKFIHYYTFANDGKLICMQDNWDIFNPAGFKWYPFDFIDKNYELSQVFPDKDEPNDSYCNGYEWTDEDAWDAMTDGMYGDYPGPGWDTEQFGN